MPDSGRPRVCLGRIAGAHGLKGEVRIRTFTEDPLSVASYGPLEDEPGTQRFEIVSARPAKGGVVAVIEDITSRDQAEALKGTELYIDRDRLPGTEDEATYYHADLIGLVAVDGNGSALGKVVAVQNFGAGDLLEIRPATGGTTILVPFTEAIVPDIDREAGWLLVIPPEGLFES